MLNAPVPDWLSIDLMVIVVTVAIIGGGIWITY